MPRKPQRSGVAPFLACAVFHHPDGVALPGQTVSLRPDAAERAIRLGLVRPADPAPATRPPHSSDQEGNE